MTLPDAVVLFGASGFLGRNLVDALRGRVMLVGVNASGRGVAGCDTTIAAGALEEVPALPARTAVVHVAAHRYVATRFGPDQPAALRTNLGLTDTVYAFAAARGITEVRAASSSAVYPANWAVQDDAPALDLNAPPHAGEAMYAWSKRFGEIAAELWRARSGISTISFRITNPYGPHDTFDEAEAHVATAFALRALGDAPEFALRGDPDAERDFVYAGDVAAAFVESLALVGTQAAVNCAYGETVRVLDLAHAAIAASGRERPIRTSPPPPGANRGVKVRRATAVRLRTLLPGLPPFRPLAEGMRLTLDWYRRALV